MQWLIDICKEWVENWFATYVGFVDRGDPAAVDFAARDLIIDGAWHELDLSGIVPENAKAVSILIELDNSDMGVELKLRKHGNVNEFNQSVGRPQVASLEIYDDVVVPLDTDRKIDYTAPDTGIWKIYLTVKGWWF